MARAVSAACSILNATQSTQCNFAYLVDCDPRQHTNFQNVCPEKCPYVDTDIGFKCAIRCVAEEDCGHFNSLEPLASKELSKCITCDVPRCKWCDTKTSCLECIKGFIVKDGQCTSTDPPIIVAIRGILIVAAIIVVPLLVYIICKPNPEGWEAGTEQGLRHRKKVFVMRGAEDDEQDGEEEYKVPLFHSFTKDFLCGIGLPLYYRSLWFMAELAVVGIVAMVICEVAVKRVAWDTNHCTSMISPDLVAEHVRRTNLRGGISATVVLVLTIVASLIHARQQKRLAGAWDARFSSMEDFVVTASGFPPEATSAKDIQRWVENLVDVQIQGVSIAYSFPSSSDQELVTEYISKTVIEDDVKMGTYTLDRDEEEEKDDGRIVNFLRTVKSSGTAFIMFKTISDAETACDTFVDEGTFDFQGHDITFHNTLSEPPSILWHNFHIPQKKLFVRFILATLCVLTCAAIFGYFIYFSILEYIMNYMVQTGGAPSAWQNLALGLLIAVENILLTQLICIFVERIGFHTMDGRNSTVMVWVFLKVMAATLFSIWLTWYRIIQSRSFGEGKSTVAAEVGMTQNTNLVLGKQIYDILLPGGLIVAFVTWPFTGYDLMFYVKKILLRVLSSKVTPRDCEIAFCPPLIFIEWDYASNLVMAASISLVLIYDFQDRWIAFVWLFLWALWMIISQRYTHLRMSHKTYFTTYRMDAVFCLTWGFVVAELGAICGWWYYDAGLLPFWGIIPCVAIPTVVYVAILVWCIRITEAAEALEENPKPYDEVANDLVYTYHNTNPVHVLKTRYLQNEGPPLSFYVPGKEYFFHKETPGQKQLRQDGGRGHHRLMPGGIEHNELVNVVYRCWRGKKQEQEYELLGTSDATKGRN